jgi:hypothetical protein
VNPVGGAEMCRMIEAKGWVLQSGRGSHHIYSNLFEGGLKPGLPNRIARDAGIEW